jgi:citrate lyase subunit beta/citryl-CoA lyase
MPHSLTDPTIRTPAIVGLQPPETILGGPSPARSWLLVAPTQISTAAPSGADCAIVDLRGAGDDPALLAALQLWAKEGPAGSRAVRLPAASAPGFDEAVELAVEAGLATVFLSHASGGADVQKLEVVLRVQEAALERPPLAVGALVSEAGLLAAQSFQRCSSRLFALGLDPDGVWQSRASDVARMARAQLVIAARAAGLSPLDTTPGDTVAKLFQAECAASRESGFTGKVAGRLDQVGIINSVFSAKR